MTARVGRHFSRPALRRLWEAAAPANVEGWRSAKGPLAGAVPPLCRIGWEVLGSFQWRGDRGIAITLTDPHRFTEELLRAGIQRSLEMQLARKASIAGGHTGVCEPRTLLDIVQTAMRSSKRSALSKAAVASFFCGACWTFERAEQSGYLLQSRLCPRCGEARGT